MLFTCGSYTQATGLHCLAKRREDIRHIAGCKGKVVEVNDGGAPQRSERAGGGGGDGGSDSSLVISFFAARLLVVIHIDVTCRANSCYLLGRIPVAQHKITTQGPQTRFQILQSLQEEAGAEGSGLWESKRCFSAELRGAETKKGYDV